MKKTVYMLAIVFLCSALHAGSIWRDRNIFSSTQSLKPGDIIIVRIREFSKMKFDFTFNGEKKTSVESSPDRNITAFLPGASAGRTFSSAESSRLNRNSDFEVSFAAGIISVNEAGMLVISGRRNYVINGESNEITIAGLVHPSQVEGNRIDSELVSNLRIEVSSMSPRYEFQYLKPEIGSDVLTDEEKRRIIIDYLEKIMSELLK